MENRKNVGIKFMLATTSFAVFFAGLLKEILPRGIKNGIGKRLNESFATASQLQKYPRLFNLKIQFIYWNICAIIYYGFILDPESTLYQKP